MTLFVKTGLLDRSSEFCTIRSITQKAQDPTKDIPKEEQGSLQDVEVNYV